jgi:hypothetical protein
MLLKMYINHSNEAEDCIESRLTRGVEIVELETELSVVERRLPTFGVVLLEAAIMSILRRVRLTARVASAEGSGGRGFRVVIVGLDAS